MAKTVGRFLLSPLAAIVYEIDPKVGSALFSVIATAAAFVPGLGPAISAAATVAGKLVYTSDGSKASNAQLSRLGLSFDPDTPRKILFGTTAGATDILYTEPEGTDQEYINYVIAVAAHEIAGIDKIYIDNKTLWSATGGIGSDYTGYATVTAREVGTAANAITISGGATWNASNCRLTGCAYIHVRLKRTGNSKKSESPFAGGVSGRWTIECRGAKVYDPRLDSTRGGSGSHRADNQATWDYTGGNNHALQALSFIIGYRINGVVSVGAGYPVNRIDYADWITAANICDESVSMSDGFPQKRYEGAGLFSDADSPASVLASLCTHMNAELRDVNGKIGIRLAVNDFSGTLPALTADDVLGEFTWTGFSPLNDSFDTVKGKYTDLVSLYQSTPYTPEALASSDIPGRRVFALDLPLCQDPVRAQRIARQVLRREQYRGTFTANFGPRAWAYPVGSVVTLTFGPAGLTAVKFRIVSQGIKIIDSEDAAQSFCPMALQVEDASIYAWSSGDAVTPPVAVAPVSYNALNGPFVLGIADAGTTAVWPSVTGTGRPADNATRNVVTYSATAPASPVDGDLWVDTSATFAVFKVRSGGAWVTGANALSAYNALSGKPVALSDINTTESSKLAGIAAGADVTSANTAAGIAGQAATATSSDFAAVTGTTKPANNATVGANASNFTGSVGGGNLLYNAGFTRRSSLRPVAYSVYNGGEIATEWVNMDGRNGGSAFGLRALAATSNTTFGLLAGDFTPEPTISGVIGGWKPNTTYMLSFWAKKFGAFVNPGMLLGWNVFPASVVEVSNPAVDASGFKRFVFRITWGALVEPYGRLYISWKPEAGTGRTAVSGDIFMLDDLQVEEGDVATSWSLGPPLADDVIYADGTRVEALKPATAGADVTAANTAAAIAGQGVLATRNRVTLGAAEGGLTNQANDTWLLDASIITGIGTAAGIAGQAATATNSNYTAITGTKPPADADKTSLNTAAAIAGQGALATQNTVDWATGVTGKPAGFGEVTVGVGETIKKFLAAYATATFSGGYGATASTATNGNRNARLLANGSVFATGDAWFAGPGEPGSGEVTGTFTNGATAQLVSFSVGYSGSAVANDTTKIFCRG